MATLLLACSAMHYKVTVAAPPLGVKNTHVGTHTCTRHCIAIANGTLAAAQDWAAAREGGTARLDLASIVSVAATAPYTLLHH